MLTVRRYFHLGGWTAPPGWGALLSTRRNRLVGAALAAAVAWLLLG